MSATASSPSTVQIVATIVQTTGVIVALAALVYTVRRDRAARLAEIRTGFLRDAYLKLAEVTSRRHITPENSMGMTLALKDIQLLGTPEQIALADTAALASRSTSTSTSIPCSTACTRISGRYSA